MKGTIKIAIACGSGVCTSTVARTKVEEVAEAINIPVDVETCRIYELEGMFGSKDIYLTTASYVFPDDIKYCMNVFPLISSFGEDECIEKLSEMIKEVYNS